MNGNIKDIATEQMNEVSGKSCQVELELNLNLFTVMLACRGVLCWLCRLYAEAGSYFRVALVVPNMKTLTLFLRAARSLKVLKP